MGGHVGASHHEMALLALRGAAGRTLLSSRAGLS